MCPLIPVLMIWSKLYLGFDTNGQPFSGFDDTDKSDFHARLMTELPIMGG